MPHFFSICIAAYRAERFIGDCLRSIANQKCCDYEVVIVDDGSPDPLVVDPELVSRLNKCRVLRTANAGPYAARQRAFDEASGEVILSLDADDELLDSKALDKLRNALDDGAEVVLFNASSSKNAPESMFDLSILGPGGVVEPQVIWNAYTTGYSLNSLSCKAFKRTLYTTGERRRRPRLLMAEDRLQSLEVMMGARAFHLIDEPLYFYRPNRASTTNAGYDPTYFRQQCYVEEEVLAFMRGRGMALDGWASYFLCHTSNVLLGLRYNSSIGRAGRMAAYGAVAGERAVREAMCFMGSVNLPAIVRARLSLLRAGRFSALDASMFPWKVGSVLKHTPDGWRRKE